MPGHENPPPIRSIQCTFLTGTYRCTWGVMSRKTSDGQMCPFHRRALEMHCHSTAEQWVLLVEEREYMQRMYSFESSLERDDLERFAEGRFRSGRLCEEDGRRAVLHTPFWYKRIEEQWYALTGLPVPVEAVAVSTPIYEEDHE